MAMWNPSPSTQSKYFEATRERPARALNLESDFVTPALQALTIGMFVFFLSIYAVWYFGWQWHFVCFATIAAGGIFFLASLTANRKLLWIVESIVQSDLDGNEVVGTPPTIRVETRQTDEHGHHWQFADLVVDQSKLINFAKDIEAGHSFSERTARRSGITQDELKDLRSEFIRKGWANWNNPKRPQQGVTLSRNGKAIIREIARAPSPMEGE
jgi:hypothetical protein